MQIYADNQRGKLYLNKNETFYKNEVYNYGRNFRMNYKSIIFKFFTFIFFATTFSFSASFSGYAGIKGDLESNSSSSNFSPALKLDGYFAGQLDFSQNLLFRTAMSIQTQDLIESKMTEKTPAVFCLDELSLTYIKPFLGITQFVSLFSGNIEGIGTDIFLQRQFGIAGITSLMTESWLGLKGATPYTLNGIGGSYVVHINNQPIATGLYIYKNNENEEKQKQINMDLRFASVFKYMTLDYAMGFAAPINSKNGSENVILLIDELYLHAGIDLLLGKKYSPNLFIQAGFENTLIDSSSKQIKLSSEKLYLLVEPRLYTGKFQAHITLFSIPKEKIEKMVFVEKDNTLGANLCIFTDKLYIKNKDITFGFNTTFSLEGKNFYDLKDIKELIKEDYTVKVSPFVNVPVMTGELKIMLQTKLTGFSTDDWKNNFKLNIGYKSVL